MTTIAGELAGWALRVRPDQVPEQARRAAARHLLDALGNAVAGARVTAAVAASHAARAMGPGDALIIGQRGRFTRAAAALANGVLIHALDFDDTHAGGLVHASAPVVPVVLAEGSAVSGAEALTALAVGLETICRLGAAAPHGFHAVGLHATAACGVFASALTAARLRGLSEEETVNALGIAGSRAGGLLEFLNTGSSTKQLHPGFAAADGLVAAALAAAGATGPSTVFEGEYGLYRALARRDADRAAIVGGLGDRWEATRITVKPYPACQLMHAQLDAAHQARVELGFGKVAADEITEVVVEAHPDAASIVCAPGKETPRSAYDAKFSLPWSLAAMLLDGSVTIATYDRIDRPEVLALAARVRTEVVDFGGVAADQPGRVRIRTAAGRMVTAQVPRSGGGPDDPGIDALVTAKALDNLGPGGEKIIELVLGLADLPSLAVLIRALENHEL
ncbi:2-methylcitrate dehydratase PrpD [Thermomonospora echinospora]|uniref:2-methylcitrate dehydratase PrpD n=1 Tax=Thermomonospora echinospora TaxID=1992 RepID=A0A1H5TZW5_9ACTN|nr:MmgE/PrpD family protein [Thermomonospora echinospora]SEF68394.1 2-methylcitrate dehydratase PrpD [Thermomonospora echinospora]